jgi:hypothetical protein
MREANRRKGFQMAIFVTLRRDNSGDTIHVNMDKVISMERHQDKYTSLKPENNELTGITVSETPAQIMDMIRRERKS